MTAEMRKLSHCLSHSPTRTFFCGQQEGRTNGPEWGGASQREAWLALGDRRFTLLQCVLLVLQSGSGQPGRRQLGQDLLRRCSGLLLHLGDVSLPHIEVT